jgi:hypothetical protein
MNIPKLKDFQIWDTDHKGRKHYHFEANNSWADIMPKLNGKSGYSVTFVKDGKILLDTDAKTPQQAHKLISQFNT